MSPEEYDKKSLHVREDQQTAVNHSYRNTEEDVIYSVWSTEKTSQFTFSLEAPFIDGENCGVFTGTTFKLNSPSN